MVRAVLFDLDGTLLDTVPDLVSALNHLRNERGMLSLPLSAIRPIANLGSKAMIKCAFEMEESDKSFNALRLAFLSYYEDHIADATQFFPNVDGMLTHLENSNIPWGIVTNKLTRHTESLLKALSISHRPACVVCGDTLTTYKPSPDPILHACAILQLEPKDCLFVGDAITDVQASKAAGTTSLVALYGYIHGEENPYTWQADGYIEDAMDVLKWVEV